MAIPKQRLAVGLDRPEGWLDDIEVGTEVYVFVTVTPEGALLAGTVTKVGEHRVDVTVPSGDDSKVQPITVRRGERYRKEEGRPIDRRVWDRVEVVVPVTETNTRLRREMADAVVVYEEARSIHDGLGILQRSGIASIINLPGELKDELTNVLVKVVTHVLGRPSDG
jgi:hypothetical protein